MGRWQTLNTGCARVTCQHFVVIMLLLLAAGGSVCAQEVDTARLRALAPFPHALLRRMSLSVGMGYAPLTGAAFFWDACDAALPLLPTRGKFSKTSVAGVGNAGADVGGTGAAIQTDTAGTPAKGGGRHSCRCPSLAANRRRNTGPVETGVFVL